MIEINELTKVYGSQVALNHLSLTIPEGQIFGFLGHNGAGKSTTIKCLTSIIEPTSGEILVDGKKLAEHHSEIKKRIGYVPDTPDIFLQLSPNEYWNLIASAFSLEQSEKEKQLKTLTQLFDIEEKESQTIESFSHGMRQKVIVIGALLSTPDIWILDEPLQGLDPQAAFDLKNLMKAHAAQGKTVIFSTHALEVAQQLCDQLAILKAGELIYTGTVDELLASAEEQSLESVYLKMVGRQQEEVAGGVDYESSTN
ncbi:ABC transporter ATP-binding protein [Lactococcus lactis]|uniref:ABC transporter ATP-binding protein n=1 Tax=Lactococcus lactis TaxID=1358 RepID=A0AAW7IUV5_9LACT|nr:ABC transporter ATP-binding protein [Lactococcus lactis]KWT46683.1 3-dehydroquinate dehydratase [Lactococcus lactis]MCT0061080.1 ABC transporter ATP-binding protein [Lactococcus lactis subsp. lactis]MCT0137473.1 ABC transporter ATP-binding protein [Lactococcus lactis subsp. lactis]MDM7546622.1 ABC transporter ATP-binding protein [Lactococcus lactis]